jgi:hypothetical protein
VGCGYSAFGAEGLRELGGADLELAHVILRLPDPKPALSEVEGMGLERRAG